MTITNGAMDDLHWFRSILQHGTLRGIPTRLFGRLPAPDVHLYMDASDYGCCILDPASNRYIAIAFDGAERAQIREVQPAATFDINVREQYSMALACVLLAPTYCTEEATLWPHISMLDGQSNRIGENQFTWREPRVRARAESVHRTR